MLGYLFYFTTVQDYQLSKFNDTNMDIIPVLEDSDINGVKQKIQNVVFYYYLLELITQFIKLI